MASGKYLIEDYASILSGCDFQQLKEYCETKKHKVSYFDETAEIIKHICEHGAKSAMETYDVNYQFVYDKSRRYAEYYCFINGLSLIELLDKRLEERGAKKEEPKPKPKIVRHKSQPCVTCKNYVDGCSWSRSKGEIPVEGWDATVVYKSRFKTYAINYCPEYIWDGSVLDD